MKPFLDTNILVYAQQQDPRSARALDLISKGGVINVQVLNEFANVLRRKLGRTWPEVEAALADIRAALGPALAITEDTHRAAMGIARDHGVGVYDALIVTSALEAGCDELLTEDLQHNRRFGALVVRNPFLEGAP